MLEPLRDLLGKVPDQQIADKAGVSRALVVNFRKRLGIPAYEGYKFGHEKGRESARLAEPRSFRGRRSALDAYLHLLGTVPDADVAKLANVTAENVRTYRHRRNIPAAWKDRESEQQTSLLPAARPMVEARPLGAHAPTSTARTSPAKPTAVAAPPAPRPAAEAHVVTAGGTAFLVVVDTEQGPRNYALVAPDIASAAGAAQQRVAVRHPNAAIRSIQRVAELLP
ncbi:MAG: hypothetical protein ACOZNI_04110 [Myxococcota bacterium]